VYSQESTPTKTSLNPKQTRKQALKLEGRRAYELARKGIEVQLSPRPVKIYGIELLEPYAKTAPV